MNSKLIITVVSTLISVILYGQNNISIGRTGKDKILLYNPNYHAVAVNVGGSSMYKLPSRRGLEIDFSLTNYNVENTVFSSFYNHACFMMDSVHCESTAIAEEHKADQKLWIASVATMILQGTNAGRVLDLLYLMFGNNPQLISEIIAAYKSSDTREQKMWRLIKILENNIINLSGIEKDRLSCIQRAYRQLNNTGTQKFYASQFISKQENFRLEITPYYVLGFNAMTYKGIKSERKSFSEIGNKQQFPLGLRTSLNFNDYTKYHRREIDKKFYVVLDYSQTSAIYKRNPTGVFHADTAYAWNFYSVGIGWETLYKNRFGKYNSSLSFDFGPITSSNFKYATEGHDKIISKNNIGSFKKFDVYACVSLKQKLLSWVDMFASYKLSANVFGKKEDAINREIPGFRQFQVGLNFILARTINYQY